MTHKELTEQTGDSIPSRGRTMKCVIFAFAILLVPRAGLSDQPNIIVFLVDDMGWQETSVAFHTERTPLNDRYRTPNMERLAKRGLKFTQAYAYAVCSPSRVSLMTGLSASRHRVTNWTLRKDRQPDHPHPKVIAADWNLNGLSPEPNIPKTVCAPTLPAILREAGYRTIHVGKAHFGAKTTPGADPLNLGFDLNIGGHAAGGPGSYHGKRNYSAAWRSPERIWDVPHLQDYHGTETNLTEALTREALKLVKTSLAEKQPFFLYLSHYAIHAPWEEDHRFIDRYLKRGLPKREAIYASMVEGMDHSLGEVLDFLDREKIQDNTIVLFLSDNGSPKQMPPNHPLRGHKLTPYEGGIRVPMLAYWPGVTPPESTCDHPVIIDDVFPTVLEAAGISLDENRIAVDGSSIVPLLRDPSSSLSKTNRALFWHYPNTYDQPPYTAMRRGPWKLVYHHPVRRLELFNLEDDLSEQQDLSEKYPERVRDLAKQMTRHLKETKALMTVDKKTKKPVEFPSDWLNSNSGK